MRTSIGVGSMAVTSGGGFWVSSRGTGGGFQAQEKQRIFVFHPRRGCRFCPPAWGADAICLFLSIRIKSNLIDGRLVYRQLARLHGGAHHLIVSLRLIGICPGECGEGKFEGVALPKVPADSGGVAGSGMGPRQRPSAHV